MEYPKSLSAMAESRHFDAYVNGLGASSGAVHDWFLEHLGA